MKITSAKVIITCPGRKFVTLKIITDQGVYGIGDGPLNGRELSVDSYLQDHVIPCLIGMDPRRIADLAALYQIRTGSHGATDLSAVTMGAALHFDSWVPNFGMQEYMRHTPETDAVFPHDYRFDKGELFCGETPGHGVDIDEALAAKYPYTPAYLAVARLGDGTVWN